MWVVLLVAQFLFLVWSVTWVTTRWGYVHSDSLYFNKNSTYETKLCSSWENFVSIMSRSQETGILLNPSFDQYNVSRSNTRWWWQCSPVSCWQISTNSQPTKLKRGDPQYMILMILLWFLVLQNLHFIKFYCKVLSIWAGTMLLRLTKVSIM